MTKHVSRWPLRSLLMGALLLGGAAAGDVSPSKAGRSRLSPKRNSSSSSTTLTATWAFTRHLTAGSGRT